MKLSLTFSQSLFDQLSPYSKHYCDFQRFFLFRNKAKNAGRSGKNAGMQEISQNAGFPAGRLTPMHVTLQGVSGVKTRLGTGRGKRLENMSKQKLQATEYEAKTKHKEPIPGLVS